MRIKLAAGNWKMNGTHAQLDQITRLASLIGTPMAEVLICPPAPLIHPMSQIAGDTIKVGGQDCHALTKGAHTGDTSAAMLADAGASYVILGHSERRADHGETDATIAAKTTAAWDAGLTAIVCVGETLDQRNSAQTIDIVTQQLAGSIPDLATAANLVVAYEPVWAIGTGLTASTEQIGAVHDVIRDSLTKRFGQDTGNGVRILYGGSMTPKNVAKIAATPNVDGGLVGGASLKADDFAQIVTALSIA